MEAASPSQIFDIPEHLDSLPHMVEALDFSGGDYACHLEGGKGESEYDHVKQVDEDDVEEPTHHIVMWVEDVEDQNYQ